MVEKTDYMFERKRHVLDEMPPWSIDAGAAAIPVAMFNYAK